MLRNNATIVMIAGLFRYYNLHMHITITIAVFNGLLHQSVPIIKQWSFLRLLNVRPL